MTPFLGAGLGAFVLCEELVHFALWRRPTFAQVARWIEENGAKLGLQNELINAVLLAQEYQWIPPAPQRKRRPPVIRRGFPMFCAKLSVRPVT